MLRRQQNVYCVLRRRYCEVLQVQQVQVLVYELNSLSKRSREALLSPALFYNYLFVCLSDYFAATVSLFSSRGAAGRFGGNIGSLIVVIALSLRRARLSLDKQREAIAGTHHLAPAPSTPAHGMRLAALVLALAALLGRAAHGWTFCDSVGGCVCRYHDRAEEEFARQHIDCSYKREAAGAGLALPEGAYSLDLSSSGLRELRAGRFPRSQRLRELVLRNNEITDIEPDALSFPELRRLDLSNNRLESIDGAVFGRITKLEYLNLANNCFTTFTKLTFHPLKDLHEIILDNNGLGESLSDVNLFDRDGFGLANKVKKVSMNGVALNAVPDNFFLDAYDLRELLLADNNLSALFEIPFTLEFLDLSDNPVRQISGEDFTDLSALKVLKLNNLTITEVSAYTFASLRDLTKLELERNFNLTEFSVFAFGQEVLDDPDEFLLEELSLKSSRLRTLDEKLQVPFGRLTRLDLQGNPWHCDCKITWFKQFQMRPNDYEHLRCSTPQSLFNGKIFELNSKVFRCARGGRRAGLAVGLIAACMFLSAATLWLFWYLPGCQAKGKFVSSMYNPTAAYAVLPLHATASEL